MTECPRRVLFIHHLDLSTPYQNTVPHYIATEVAERHTVHVICREMPNRRTEREQYDGLVFYDIDTGSIPFFSGLLFVLLSTLYSLVLGVLYRYDVVYAFQKTILQGFVGSQASRSRFILGLQSVPLRQLQNFRQVSDVNDSPSIAKTVKRTLKQRVASVYAVLISTLLPRATTIICLTKGIRDLTEETYDVDLSRAKIIGMGVSVDTFRNQGSGCDDSDSDAVRIVYVGSVSTSRGVGQLLDAIAKLEGDAELTVAGTGPDKSVSRLKQRARDLGIAGRVEWLGFVRHEDIPGLLQRADVAVSPLRNIESFRVSFPAKILEYLSAGCIVVATDIPPHRRIISNRVNGFLYDGSTTGLVETLDECRQDGSNTEQIREAARSTAEQYDWERVIAEHESVMFGETDVED